MKTFFEYLEGSNSFVLRESVEIYDGLLKMIDENNYSDDSFLIFADWLESVGRSLDSMFVRLVIDNNEVKHYVGSVRWHLGLKRIRSQLDNPSMEDYDKSNINHNFFNVARNHRFDFQAIPFIDLIRILAHAGVGLRHSISFDAAKFLVTWYVMSESQISTLMHGVKYLREREQLLPFIFEKYPNYIDMQNLMLSGAI